MPEWSGPILEVEGLSKTFNTSSGVVHRQAHSVDAVRALSFGLTRGGSLGIVGESGSGKTTVARILMGLEPPTEGQIRLDGVIVGKPASATARRVRARQMQMVFQDPYRSLDPRQHVGEGLDEIQRLHFRRPASDRARRSAELVEAVGLSPRDAAAVPRALSGGQRQRVAIARALASEPAILILDEAVSALDVSIQAQILNLLADLRARLGLTYIVISHDLAVVRQVADECLVMYRGTVVERGDVTTLLTEPRHPYTQRLVASVPRPGMALELRTDRSSLDRLPGCVFRGRCPSEHGRCSTEPPLLTVTRGHAAKCWLLESTPIAERAAGSEE